MPSAEPFTADIGRTGPATALVLEWALRVGAGLFALVVALCGILMAVLMLDAVGALDIADSEFEDIREIGGPGGLFMILVVASAFGSALAYALHALSRVARSIRMKSAFDARNGRRLRLAGVIFFLAWVGATVANLADGGGWSFDPSGPVLALGFWVLGLVFDEAARLAREQELTI